MSGILRLENLNRGTTLKQGDKTVLSYRLSDADGENLNIAGNTAVARLMHPDFTRIGYESEALTVSADNIVQFSIDSIIPSRLYYLEITVDGQYIFPSRSDEGKLSIDRSSMGAEITIIENYGIDAVVRKAVDLINEDPSLIIDEDKLISEIIANTSVGSIEEYYQEYRDAIKEYADLKPKAEQAIVKADTAITRSGEALLTANGIDAKATEALSKSTDADTLSKSVQEQFNQVVIDGDSSVESAQARVTADGVTKATLKERLDDEHIEVTAQLAQTKREKIGGGVKANLEDLSSDVLSAIEGGEGTSFDLLSIPQNKSVTYKKISDTLLDDFNGFELNTLHNSSVTHNIKGSEIDVSNIDISGKEIKVTFEFIAKTENLSAIRASVWQESSGQQRNINQSPATTPILDETVSFTYSFTPTESRDTLTLFLNLTVPTQGSFSHSYIRNIFVNVGGTPYKVESLTPSGLAPESSIMFIESLPTQLVTIGKLEERTGSIDTYFNNKTVMTFGDSLTWYDGQPFANSHKNAGQIAKGYQSYLREELGVNIINKGGSGYRLADNILGLIKDADYTGVDYVTITSGANDGRANKTVGELQSIGSNFDETTYIGALQSAIEHIYSVNNKIKIFLLTPVKGWQDNLGEVTEPYANAILKVSDLYSLPVCDWHYGSGINEVNKNYYMGDKRPDTNYDLHPINAGFENMGRMLVATFKSH